MVYAPMLRLPQTTTPVKTMTEMMSVVDISKHDKVKALPYVLFWTVSLCSLMQHLSSVVSTTRKGVSFICDNKETDYNMCDNQFVRQCIFYWRLFYTSRKTSIFLIFCRGFCKELNWRYPRWRLLFFSMMKNEWNVQILIIFFFIPPSAQLAFSVNFSATHFNELMRVIFCHGGHDGSPLACSNAPQNSNYASVNTSMYVRKSRETRLLLLGAAYVNKRAPRH